MPPSPVPPERPTEERLEDDGPSAGTAAPSSQAPRHTVWPRDALRPVEVAGQEHASSEAIARAFHEEYEARAPHHGYRTREESAVPWEQVPEANRNLMIGTVDALLRRGVIACPACGDA